MIIENLKENENIDSDHFVDEKRNFLNLEIGNFGAKSEVPMFQGMKEVFRKKRRSFENMYKLIVNAFFLMVIILFCLKKIETQNLLESCA